MSSDNDHSDHELSDHELSDHELSDNELSDHDLRDRASASRDVPLASVEYDMVARKIFKVVQWEPVASRQNQNPNVKAWMVDFAEDIYRKTRVWVLTGYIDDFLRELEENGVQHESLDLRGWKGGFCKGRAMVSVCKAIQTCGGADRPRFLYRVIHDGTPYGGLKSRSWNEVQSDALHFQVQLQKHLNWDFRGKGPFLSLTKSRDQASHYAAVHEAHGRTGIRILRTDTWHPSFIHDQSPMWHVHSVMRALGLGHRYPKDHEYVIENSIPEQAMAETIEWDDVKDTWDPQGHIRRKARKPVIRKTKRAAKVVSHYRYGGWRVVGEARDRQKRCRDFVGANFARQGHNG